MAGSTGGMTAGGGSSKQPGGGTGLPSWGGGGQIGGGAGGGSMYPGVGNRRVGTMRMTPSFGINAKPGVSGPGGILSPGPGGASVSPTPTAITGVPAMQVSGGVAAPPGGITPAASPAIPAGYRRDQHGNLVKLPASAGSRPDFAWNAKEPDLKANDPGSTILYNASTQGLPLALGSQGLQDFNSWVGANNAGNQGVGQALYNWLTSQGKQPKAEGFAPGGTGYTGAPAGAAAFANPGGPTAAMRLSQLLGAR